MEEVQVFFLGKYFKIITLFSPFSLEQIKERFDKSFSGQFKSLYGEYIIQFLSDIMGNLSTPKQEDIEKHDYAFSMSIGDSF